MIIRKVVIEDFGQLAKLQIDYKQSIKEEMPDLIIRQVGYLRTFIFYLSTDITE
ncbi:MAG: hypothetical protein K0R00_3977 [Herbinix sp.]|jgi:hypothetical protein|nr:hypothetical protein [Herbinix sp.]